MEPATKKVRRKRKFNLSRYIKKTSRENPEALLVIGILLVFCVCLYVYSIFQEDKPNYIKPPIEVWERDK